MALIIDGYAHIMPKTFAEVLNTYYPTDELQEMAAKPYFSEVENRLRVLDKYKIDKQVLTLAGPSIWIGMPKDIVMKMTRAANDALSRVAQQFPDRFIPVGTLPIPSEEFLPEFDRCIGDLGMAGMFIPSNIGGRPLDHPEYTPFFKKAHRTCTPIWLHPQLRPEWSPEFALHKIFGWLFDTSLALGRLVFSGIMEEFPDLRIITHHMGAMIPHFSERIKSFYECYEMHPQSKFTSLPKDPLEYFKRFYGDSVLNGSAHAFECGYKFFGPKQIIFGTDYPFGPEKGEAWMKGSLHQIAVADLPQTEKDQILGGNLQRLLERR
jgi:aminocarboxymuconate-semialdehyde decarboxylase